ncbi:MAG: tRNA1(Val) (adenine(37)-N6)-methyltransferase [Ruminococcaceae bacterium]|nr:tRNA1(Val) (adenine(37)-N6)-methyltransferase [Oscillospiraceae bacterium]
MEEKFRLETIDIYVNEDHRFGTDAVLLADFAAPYPSETVCDLCTGCGIIPLFFCKNRPPKRVYGVELQKEAVNLFKRSVKENKLEDKVFPIEADLTDLKALAEHIPRGSVDTVTVNPPYYKENSGKTKLSQAQRIARHEIACSLRQVTEAADFLLKYGGTLKMCHLPERLAEIFYLMQERNIQPKKLTLVYNKEGEKPWLALVSGKKGGKAGLDVGKPLVMRNANGEYTKELLNIYGMDIENL